MHKLEIEYIKHDKIPLKYWDTVINKSFNSNVYALSSYLNITSQGKWNALVTSDYSYIMPLPVKNKFFVKLSLHPIFSQQLGIFSPFSISPEIVKKFVEAIPPKIKYVELKFNKFNNLSLVKRGEIKTNINYELDLILPYDALYKNYSTNTKRNIKKAQKNYVTIKYIGKENFYNFFKYHFSTQFKGVLKNKDFKTLKKLLDFTDSSSDINNICIGATDHSLGELLAVAFFIKFKNKIYYIDGVSSQKGKEKSAMFLIFDHIIKTKSSQNYILDFEGSNIESVARFYKGFGAIQTTYNTLIINRLGALAKLKR
jgi:hypothetical protein